MEITAIQQTARHLLHKLERDGKAFPPDSKRNLRELIELTRTLPDFQRKLPHAEKLGVSRGLLLAAIPYIEERIREKEKWIDENHLRTLPQKQEEKRTPQI